MEAGDGQVRTGRRWVPALAGLCVLLVASACTAAGGARDLPTVLTADPAPVGTPEGSAPPPGQGTTAEVTPPPASGLASTAPATAAALDFTARRLDGGTLHGAQLAGEPVVLWMWAPWCPQCNREAAHVAEALRAHGRQVTFVGMAGHDTDEAHRSFVEEHGLGDMLHVVDEDGSLWSSYGISYQPAWVFIAADGTAEVVAGGLYDDLEPRLQALLDR